MGELEAIEPLQMELNQTRTQMMNHRKRFSRKWLYKESAFDADGRSALESDEDNVMVPVISEEALTVLLVQCLQSLVHQNFTISQNLFLVTLTVFLVCPNISVVRSRNSSYCNRGRHHSRCRQCSFI
jgi:hypothetical protein